MDQNLSHDIFTDPALARAKDEDPVVKFIATHWREMLISVVVVLGGYYVYNRYQTTQYESKVSAADLLVKAQESVDEVTVVKQRLQIIESNPADKTKPEEVENLKKRLLEAESKLSQRITALGDLSGEYGALSSYYQIVAALKENKLEDAQKILTTVLGQGESNSDTDFVTELAELMVARAALDTDQGQAKARAALMSLAKNSRFIHAAAAVTLARISRTDQEKKEALDVLNEIKANHPEQTDLLTEEIDHLSAQ